MAEDEDIITALNSLQVQSTVKIFLFVLEKVKTPIVHAGKERILNLQEMMKEYGISLTIIEHSWRPQCQRENDTAL